MNLLANAAEPVCVCDFMPQLDLAQGTVSFHHKKLLDAGLLDREQRGTWAHLNPAVTPLGRVFTGVSSVAAAVYLAAQVAGAVLANLMFGLPAVTTSTPCAHRA